MNTIALPYLTDDEISEICAPLRMAGAQCRYLRDKLGFVVKTKPNGKPLVARGEFERVLVGRQDEQSTKSAASQPNRDKLLKLVNGGRHGSQAR